MGPNIMTLVGKTKLGNYQKHMNKWFVFVLIFIDRKSDLDSGYY